MANALLGRDANPTIALQLINSGLTIGIDEYHHFFSEKNTFDLFLEPTFALPVFGVTLAALLFMIWGRLNLEDAYGSRTTDTVALPYHALNQRILRGLTIRKYSEDDFTKTHAEYLTRLFPAKEVEIDSIQMSSGKPLDRAKALLELHQRIAKDKV